MGANVSNTATVDAGADKKARPNEEAECVVVCNVEEGEEKEKQEEVLKNNAEPVALEPSQASPWYTLSQKETRQATMDRIEQETNYYAILGVAADQNQAEIRRAYWALMRWLHPDKQQCQQDDSIRSTIERRSSLLAAAKVNEAYSVLSDPQRREAYDAHKEEQEDVVVWFAKHTAGSLVKTFTNPLASHTVQSYEDLLEGDHIYFLVGNGVTSSLAHHGIVVRTPPRGSFGSNVGGHRGGSDADDGDEARAALFFEQEIRVVDLGVMLAAGGSTGTSPLARQQGTIREVSLGEFLPPSSRRGLRFRRTTLKRAEYNQTSWDCRFKLVGAYRDAPDPPHHVTQRARRLCLLGNSDEITKYDFLSNKGGETAAFWCKTGQRYSGQAPKLERFVCHLAESTRTAANVTGRTVAVLALAAGGVAAMEATGWIAQGTLASTVASSSSAVVYGVANPFTIALGVAGGALLCAGTGLAMYKWMLHQRQRQAPAWHVIHMITQLDSRDRRAAARQHQDPDHDGGPAEALARLLDACVAPTTSADSLMPWSDDASSIAAYVANQFHYHFQHYLRRQQQQKQDPLGGGGHLHEMQKQSMTMSGDADAAMDFAVQTLVRCQLFHAILDLPDATDGSEISYIITTLKSCEFHLLECQALHILPNELHVQRVDPPPEKQSSWKQHRAPCDDPFMDMDDEEDAPKPLFRLRAHARSVVPSQNHAESQPQQEEEGGFVNDPNGPASSASDRVLLDSFKVADDFHQLHDILVELHPGVQQLTPPPMTCDDPGAFDRYLSNLLRLSSVRGGVCWQDDDPSVGNADAQDHKARGKKRNSKSQNKKGVDDDYYYQQQHRRSIDDYLHHLQMLQVQEQVVAFVGRSSRQAWQLWLEQGHIF